MDQLLSSVEGVITSSTAATGSVLDFALLPVAGFVLAITVAVVVITMLRTRIPGAIKRAAGVGRRGRGRRRR